ncbi:MAG: cytochrome P450 [Kofleriaceae bacterium]|nr:cytochrome P450 [Myxococcales bacterium]MCB9561224.1 cytochrome P450 [Kofleriaceae bacterium]MCB9573804.1 cytochrome P450 [Kofleriaceae bacterium]
MPPTLNVDVYDLDRYVEGVPHDAFRVLRAEAPVYFHPEPDGVGFWAITKYADVVQISKDPYTFSSWRGGTNIKDYPPDSLDIIRMLMLNMDPPQHNKFRRLTSTGFTPRMIARMEEYIRAAARKIVDDVAPLGACDFVTKIAAELPLVVICDIMGVPQEDRHLVFDWSNRLIGFDDPEFQTSLDDAQIAASELWAYANQLAEERKGKGGKDLVSVLLDAEIDGEQLDEMEFDAFFLLLSVAGNETTRNLISGGMVALMEHPEQRARLLADPTLLPSAVEEMLRWVTPVIHFRRTATRDVELRGQPIKENDKVVLYYASANRDEEVFADGHRFDIGRTPNDHIAFGIGQHSCLGLNLARLEIKVMFEELLRRMPDIEPAGPARRLRSNFINGVKELPVRYTPST